MWLHSPGITTEGTTRTTVVRLFAHSVPISRVSFVGSPASQFGGSVSMGRVVTGRSSGNSVEECIVGAQLVGIREHLESTKCPARRCVDNRRSFVIPAAALKACTQSVVGWVPGAPEPIDDHLPDAVFNPAERVLHPGQTFRGVQKRYGCLITERSDGCPKPAQCFFSRSENFDCPCEDIHNRTRFQRGLNDPLLAGLRIHERQLGESLVSHQIAYLRRSSVVSMKVPSSRL